MHHSHRLINIFCQTFLLPPRTWCLRWAKTEKSDPVSWTSLVFLLYFLCVCVRVSVPASQLSNTFLSVSSRCALSYQACQTLTFRRCLLLDTIAKLPEPEGKHRFPSLSTSISVSLSVSHLLPSPSMLAFIPLCRAKSTSSKQDWRN